METKSYKRINGNPKNTSELIFSPAANKVPSEKEAKNAKKPPFSNARPTRGHFKSMYETESATTKPSSTALKSRVLLEASLAEKRREKDKPNAPSQATREDLESKVQHSNYTRRVDNR